MKKSIREGELRIGNKNLSCSVLEDGTRIISQSAIFKAFGRPKRGKMGRVINMPPFLDAKNLNAFIGKELRTVIRGIKYLSKTGNKKLNGYRAEILPLICDVYLEARATEGVLTKNQRPLIGVRS